MIIIFLDRFEDFLHFLQRRLMDEVFYEVRELPSTPDRKDGRHAVVLHFLGAMGSLTGVYETQVVLNQVASREELVEKLKDMLAEHSISLIQGKIREIFISFS
ncbi:MAG: hypothetical protein Kow0069_37440 [Promethearchaeota archaeon]